LTGAREKFEATRYQAYEQAAVLMRALIQAPKFPDFLTVPAYAEVMAKEKFETAV
jgi:malate synthase